MRLSHQWFLLIAREVQTLPPLSAAGKQQFSSILP